MKTSNKIILSGFLFLLLTFVCALLYGRKYIVKGEIDHIQGNGIKGELVLKENFDSDTLYISDSREYFLDPNSTSIKVTGEENVISIFEARNYRGLNIKRTNWDGLSTSMPIKFVIGVKDKQNLTLIIKDNAYLTSLSPLSIDSLNIEISDRANLNINNKGENLFVKAKHSSFIDIQGEYKTADILGLSDFTLDAIDVSFDTLKINLEMRSLVKIKGANVVEGRLEDDAQLKSIDSLNLDQVKFYDYSRHKIVTWD